MEETRVLALSGELALAGRARAALLHLLRRREESEACGGGGRWVLEPESVLFLEIISLLPVPPCLHAV